MIKDNPVAISINKFKDLPGICGIYIFKKGRVNLYVGKSVNLRARVASHMENAKFDEKEASIVGQSDHIAYTVTDSEFKALILESKLIQNYRPRYNTVWKDDKSYLYVKITVREPYPKISIVRKEIDGKSRYFGPFSSVRSVETVLRKVRKIFPYCAQKKTTRTPCFYSKIGLCTPCPNQIEHTQDPAEKKRLKSHYRKNILRIASVLDGNADTVLNRMYAEVKCMSKDQQYEQALKLRDTIFYFERVITDTSSFWETETSYDNSASSLKELQKFLSLYFSNIISLKRIECYDVSNLMQKEATASMIVFEDGLINKSEYRKFKIRRKNLSDFEMIQEVLERRLKREWAMPNLIVVDGGKPQVRYIRNLLLRKEIPIPVIGLAKNPDRVVIGDFVLKTVRKPLNDLGFSLLRRMRDESHRFAKKYHLLLRRKKLML